jgi:hypothetical protein
MKSVSRRLGALVALTGALAVAVPSTAGAVVFPLPGGTGVGGAAVGGNQIGQAGCVGTNRPSVGGNAGSTANQTCGAALAFTGPAMGQIASVVGPTMIGAQIFAPVVASAGPPIVGGP